LFKVISIPRLENEKEDSLVRLASATRTKIRRLLPVEILHEPSIEAEKAEMEVCINFNLGASWMDPIIDNIKNGNVTKSKAQSRKIRYRREKITIIRNILYKMGFLLQLLKCVHLTEVSNVLRVVHEGSCLIHIGG